MTFVDEPRPLSWQCNCNLANCRGGFQLENLKKGNLANSRSGNRTGPPCLWPCGDQSATSSPPPPSTCVSLFYPWQCSLSCQSFSTQFSVHTTWTGTLSLVFFLSLVSLFLLLLLFLIIHHNLPLLSWQLSALFEVPVLFHQFTSPHLLHIDPSSV